VINLDKYSQYISSPWIWCI